MRYPRTIKKTIMSVRQNPTVAKNNPKIPAITAPEIALFILNMEYCICHFDFVKKIWEMLETEGGDTLR